MQIKRTCIAILCVSAQSVLAANFTIQAFPGVPLPTSVNPGQTVVAYFTVTNNQNFPLSGYQVVGLPDTVVQDNTAPNYYNSLPICSKPINLAANASCLLQLDITGFVPKSYFAICKGNSCTSSGEPLHVKPEPTPTTPRFAYVTQYGASPNNVMVCSLDSSQLIDTCNPAGGGVLFQSLNPSGIRFNNSGSTAFITIDTSPVQPIVYQCPVFANTGMFGTCTQTTISSPTGYDAGNGFLALSADNTLSYLPDNTGQRVLACPIANNIIGSSCTDIGVNSIGQATGIALNGANNNVFIGSYSNYVTTCQLSGTNANHCGQKTGDGLGISFGIAVDIAVNNIGTIAYITDNSNGFVYGCEFTVTHTASSSFDRCFIASQHYSIQPWGIALNATSTMAYITDFSNNVHQCPILATGTFGLCTTNSSFSQTIDIQLYY